MIGVSKVKIGRVKNVNIGSGGGGARISIGAGGVAILVIVVLAATHQHTTLAVFQGVVWALAFVGAGVVAYGVWWFRQRTAVQPPPVCACQQHPVPAGHQAVEVPAAAHPPAIQPAVTNYFFGDATAAEAIQALGGRRDP